jgi:hypothetical protein
MQRKPTRDEPTPKRQRQTQVGQNRECQFQLAETLNRAPLVYKPLAAARRCVYVLAR